MGEKDIAQKNFEAYNDVVADIVNGSLFDGREIIKAESLVDVPELNHIERKIVRWGFLDGMSIRQVAERLCLSETRVKHLKRGAMDKIADFMEREVGYDAYKSDEKEVQL